MATCDGNNGDQYDLSMKGRQSYSTSSNSSVVYTYHVLSWDIVRHAHVVISRLSRCSPSVIYMYVTKQSKARLLSDVLDMKTTIY